MRVASGAFGLRRLNLAALSRRASGYCDLAMRKLFEQIRSAVANDRFFVAWHADERCGERGSRMIESVPPRHAG